MSEISLGSGAPARPVRPQANLNLVRLKKITRVGLKSIYSHGLRSLLTVLGIVIGVARSDCHAGGERGREL